VKKGDKVIIMEEICANNLKNPHYKKMATVLEPPDRFGSVKVSVDDFPNCNHRDLKNQFRYDLDELDTL
jgi:hypothetical protein